MSKKRVAVNPGGAGEGGGGPDDILMVYYPTTDRDVHFGDEMFRVVEELGRRKILISFMFVDNLGSAQLGTLITLHRKLQALGGKLVLCDLPQTILGVFQIAKLDKLLTIMPDEQSGLLAF